MKKFLSLVLALVMTMSLVTVSAGAKDFTDDSEITYKEAVDVISALGVVDGYSGGDFRPDDVLTRGAAAKIICNLILGPTTASALNAGTAPFKDVPVTNTFAGYITYCSQQGIISGYADGTFRPTGTLSGNAFMKMLLGALGYDSSIEGYTGGNWSVSVIKQAAGIGLDDGNDEFVGSKAVTREEAALYASNMLQATMVEYDAKTTVNVNGATVTVAGNKAQDKAWGTATNNDGNIDDDGFVQFAEQYFDKLTLRSVVDSFGRPSNRWANKGVEIGTYPKTAGASYTENVTLGTIYADLGMTDKDEKAEVYVDGVLASELAKVSKGNDAKIADLKFAGTDKCSVGNGTLVEAYLDEDTNDVTIACINTYVAEVNKVVAASGNKDAYITLSDTTNEGRMPAKFSPSDEFETEGFESDDIVLFTYSNADEEIKSVVKAESVTGALSKLVLTKSVSLGEETYKFSNKYGTEYGEGRLDVDSEYVVYLDDYGYAIYVEETEYNIADYAFLRALQSGSVVFNTDKAALVTYDGKTKTVDTTKDYLDGVINTYANNTEKQIGDAGAKIVVTKALEDGDYRLKAVETLNVKNDSSFDMVNSDARINLTVNGTAATYFANSATVFVVKNGTSYRAYTGIKNAPTITADTSAKAGTGDVDVSLYCRSGNMVTIAFIDATNADYISAGSRNIVFLAEDSESKHTFISKNDYYSYNAVVDGEIKEVLVQSTLDKLYDPANALLVPGDTGAMVNENMVFVSPQYDDGVITELTQVNSAAPFSADVNYDTVTGTEKLNENYTITLGGANGTAKYTLTVDTGVKVFLLDDDGVITEGDIKNVRKSDTDVATFVLEDGQITYLFVQQFTKDKEFNGDVSKAGTLSFNARAGFGATMILGTYERPSHVPLSAAATVVVNVFADGKFAGNGTLTFVSGSKVANVSVPTATTGDEAITLEVVSEIFTHVNVRYVNADTKTEIAQNTTNFTTLPTAAVSTTAGSGSISFQLKTTSTDNISYTIKQGDTVVKTATTSAANASVTAASLTVAQTAEVVVEISGLSAAKAKYDYTNSLSSSGDNLSAFGVAGTTDASGLKLTIAVTPGSLTTGTANITEGEVYTLSATLSGNPADASAYKVSIPSLGLEFVLSKAQLTDNADFTVKGNVTLNTTTVKVAPVAKLSYETNWAADGKSVTLSFNRAVTVGSATLNVYDADKSGGAGNLATTDYTVAWNSDNTSVTVSLKGATVFGTGDKITLATADLEDEYDFAVVQGDLATKA